MPRCGRSQLRNNDQLQSMDRSLRPPLLQNRACRRVGGQRVPRITEHFSNHPPPSELMRLSNSSRSPATSSKQAWMMTGSAVASAHLAHLTAAGHRVTCSPSPTLPLHRVTPSVVNEPAAHITVRPCQAITAIQFGYYENSGTVSLSTGRPSRVPRRRNVRAPLRCPIHALQCAHCASPIGQGVVWKKADSIHTDGVGSTDVLPTSVRFHRWTLGFGKSISHHMAQALRDHALHVFKHLPLSDQAVVPSPFRV
jgi:hypothetical protein